MAKLYGIGAAVVIMGALFKIIHLPFANEMLFVGLTTEAVIFFFSAFEPPHVEPDWSLVYPELAGMYHGVEDIGDDLPEFMEDEMEEEEDLSVSQQLDEMLDKANIGPELIESLGSGLRNLNDTAGNMNKFTDAAEANTEFVQNVKGASSSVNQLSETYTKASDALAADIESTETYHDSIKSASVAAASLSESYQGAAEAMANDVSATGAFNQSVTEATEKASLLAQEYAKSIETMRQSSEALDFTGVDGSNYNDEIKKISSNLAALNAVYELQLQSSNDQVEASARIQDSMSEFLEKIGTSIDTTKKYEQGVAVLANNVESLNQVYGNMLSAMNVAPKA
ncbi:MAG: gliding motility protein GldL [Bacteroidales bacterium]|nr:gliding motility protein GldL [Bacteroidales bacterium]